MGEFLEAVKSKYMKQKNSEIVDKMNKQRIKVGILNLCDTKIQDEGDTLVFECAPKDLQYVIDAINEDPLKSKYLIQQVSETLFQASRVILDI